MSRTIAKPKLVPHKLPVFDEPQVHVVPQEKKEESISRANVEVWNSSFPRRDWLDAESEDVSTSPRVRPGGHERGGTSPEPQAQTASDIIRDLDLSPLASELPGLCRNCARLVDCTYPRPEGGVWHCDEYE